MILFPQTFSADREIILVIILFYVENREWASLFFSTDCTAFLMGFDNMRHSYLEHIDYYNLFSNIIVFQLIRTGTNPQVPVFLIVLLYEIL